MKKSLLSVLLLLLLLFAAPPAHAVETPTFSVTVPVALPVAVSADGSVSVASDARIVNNSAGAVTLDAVSVVPLNSWQLDAWGTDYSAVPVNSKRFSMRLFGGADASELADISAGDAMDISYDVRLAAQTDNLNEAIARIVFTVSWAGRGPLSGIAVTTPPSTTEYDAGAVFDSAGMVVTATYADGTTAAVTGWTVTDGATLTEGQTSVTVSYTEGGVTRTATTPVTVNAESAESGDAYAMLYDTDSDGIGDQLVFQRGNRADSTKTLVASFTGFESGVFNSYEDDDDEYHSGAPWYEYSESITTAVFIHAIAPENTAHWFENFKNLTLIDGADLLEVGTVQNMFRMFYGCRNLTELDVSCWDTGSAVNMGSMFEGCHKINALAVSIWNTGNVTNMARMFLSCRSIQNLDLHLWNTSNVVSVGQMFYGCDKMESLNLSGWDLSSLNSLNVLVSNCRSLAEIDVSGWDTSEITSMQTVFSGCSSLTALDLSSWDTRNVTTFSNMFFNCTNLQTVYVSSNFQVSSSANTANMMYNCTAIVGGRGTTYDENYANGEYARIDKRRAPGYFTEKSVSTLSAASPLSIGMLNGLIPTEIDVEAQVEEQSAICADSFAGAAENTPDNTVETSASDMENVPPSNKTENSSDETELETQTNLSESKPDSASTGTPTVAEESDSNYINIPAA